MSTPHHSAKPAQLPPLGPESLPPQDKDGSLRRRRTDGGAPVVLTPRLSPDTIIMGRTLVDPGCDDDDDDESDDIRLAQIREAMGRIDVRRRASLNKMGVGHLFPEPKRHTV